MGKRCRNKRRANAAKRTAADTMTRPTMDLDTALAIVDDDLPDGAYWALLEEMTGLEAAEIADRMIASEATQ